MSMTARSLSASATSRPMRISPCSMACATSRPSCSSRTVSSSTSSWALPPRASSRRSSTSSWLTNYQSAISKQDPRIGCVNARISWFMAHCYLPVLARLHILHLMRNRDAAEAETRHGRGGNVTRPRQKHDTTEAETRHGRGEIRQDTSTTAAKAADTPTNP